LGAVMQAELRKVINKTIYLHICKHLNGFGLDFGASMSRVAMLSIPGSESCLVTSSVFFNPRTGHWIVENNC
jgi:predicted transcriptional regulator